MSLLGAEGPARARQAKVKEAIALALRNQWEEAVEANKALLATAPDDVETLNRLAKALLELGRYGEARDGLAKVLKIAPSNVIARKNLDRVAKAEGAGTIEAERKIPVSLKLFIEEAGKSGTTALLELAPKAVLQRLVGGEQVLLQPEGSRLTARSRRNEYIGRVPPRPAQRLLSLLAGGNRYAAAVLQVGDQEVRLIIREVYQHPSQVGKPSFPPPRPDGFRPYVRGRSLVYYELEEPALGAVEELGEAEEPGEEKPARGVRGREDDEEEAE